jgi:hypothetical protein
MLECQRCGHDVICTYTILEKYQRFWLDLDQRVLFGSGLCQSLRHLSQEWSALLGSSVGLRTINERINQIEPLLGPTNCATRLWKSLFLVEGEKSSQSWSLAI